MNLFEFSGTWQVAIAVATVLFVAGQTCVRFSGLSTRSTAALFMVTMGIAAAIAWLATASWGRNVTAAAAATRTAPLLLLAAAATPAVAAGFLFAGGNALWVWAIHDAPNIALIRVLMAGLEIAALAVVAALVFGQMISWKQAALTVIGLASFAVAAVVS
jgi:hypothetical protein